MLKYITIFLIIIGSDSYQAQAQKLQKNHSLSPQQKLQELFNPKSTAVLVSAHRGDWRNAPENSLQGLKNCIAMGVDIVELDLKRTKDGYLVVMHDKLIDRSTNGKGKPSDYTLEEIRKFKLKNGLGRTSSHPIPTFEEMLMAAKNKVLINVDKGYDYFDQVVEMLRKTGTADQAILNIDDNTYLDSVEARYGAIDASAVIMPIINYKVDSSGSILKSYLKHRKTIFQPVFDRDTFIQINNQAGYRAKGYGMWINSLWASLNGGHDDDNAVEENKPDETWGWLIKKGANVIQTDRPKQLLEYLRSKQLHQ